MKETIDFLKLNLDDSIRKQEIFVNQEHKSKESLERTIDN